MNFRSLSGKLLVNPRVQLRFVAYGLFAGILCTVYTINVCAVAQRDTDLSQRTTLIFTGIGILLLTMITLLGLVISNQVSGPLFRLHRNLKLIAEGKIPEQIRIRKGDAYEDLFTDYNRVVEKLGKKIEAGE